MAELRERERARAKERSGWAATAQSGICAGIRKDRCVARAPPPLLSSPSALSPPTSLTHSLPAPSLSRIHQSNQPRDDAPRPSEYPTRSRVAGDLRSPWLGCRETVLHLSRSYAPLTLSKSLYLSRSLLAINIEQRTTEVIWNYCPTGIDQIRQVPCTVTNPNLAQSSTNIGSTFIKAQYRCVAAARYRRRRRRAN